MMRPDAPGMLSASHRARAVRRWAVITVAGVLMFSVVSGAVRGDQPPTAGAAADATLSVEPVVAAAVANPLRAPARILPTGVDPSEYRAVLAAGTAAGVAYGSYNPSLTVAEWVRTIPGLSESAAASLTAAAGTVWQSITEGNVTAVAVAAGPPEMVAYQADTGAAQVRVRVTQTVTSPAGSSTGSKSYLVSLGIAPRGRGWEVTGLVGG